MNINAISLNTYSPANFTKAAEKQNIFANVAFAGGTSPITAEPRTVATTPAPATGQVLPGSNLSSSSKAVLLALQEVNEPADASATSTASTRDFTNMTRKGIFDWMNGQITSGKMTLDESSPFLAMTVKMSPTGTHTLDSQERMNFVDTTKSAISFYQSHGYIDSAQRFQNALSIMERYQS